MGAGGLGEAGICAILRRLKAPTEVDHPKIRSELQDQTNFRKATGRGIRSRAC